MNNLDSLQRLEQSLKRARTSTREQLVLSGFEFFISASSEPYMNYAIPKVTENWSLAIQELVEVCVAQDRQPRLEYFHELYPMLKPALEQAGFVQEMTAPVMILLDTDLSRQIGTAQADYVVLEDKEMMLETFLKRQSLAFGGLGDESSLSWLNSLKQGLQKGSLFGAALTQKGEIVSGAIIQGKDDGELAGVWTLPSKQKQGLSYTLCQKLLTDYFAKGQSLCWLSAAEDAQKLYANLGFKAVGTQLNMSLANA